MGRYDKIKVYSDDDWQDIEQIKVYSNIWNDFGTSNSASVKPIYAYDSDLNPVRATLNKRSTVITEHLGLKNQIDISNINMSTTYGNNYDFKVSCTIVMTALPSSGNNYNIAYCHNTATNGGWDFYIDSSGYLHYYAWYGSYSQSATSSRTLTASTTPVAIEVYISGRTLTFKINGSSAGRNSNFYGANSQASCAGKVGNTSSNFWFSKNQNIEIRGSQSSGAAASMTIDTGPNTGYVSNIYKTTRTEITWE